VWRVWHSSHRLLLVLLVLVLLLVLLLLLLQARLWPPSSCSLATCLWCVPH
jgi:hypothetical protein